MTSSTSKLEIVLPVRFSVDGRAVQTTTRELSADGLFVRCLAPPAPGSQVLLKLYLPGSTEAAEFSGLVREAQTAQGSAGFWADFVSASHGAHTRLLELLAPGAPAKKSVTPDPAPLGSLHTRTPVSNPPHGLPPPPAAPATVPLPEEQPLPGGRADDVAGLIQGALDAEVSQRAGEMLRERRGPSPGARKSPPQPEVAAVSAPVTVPPPPSATPGEVVLAGDVGGRNRRTFPRYRARFAVRFSSIQDFVLEYAANISAGGVFVLTEHPPEMDSVITVVLELPDGGAPVSCKAQVVHRVTKEQAAARGEQAGAGVQFIEADDAFRERIDQTIGQILDKGAA